MARSFRQSGPRRGWLMEHRPSTAFIRNSPFRRPAPVTHWNELDERNVRNDRHEVLDRFYRGPEDPAYVYQALCAGLEEALRRSGRATVLLMPLRSLSGHNEVSNQLGAAVRRALTLL